MRILLLEDNRLDADLARRALRRADPQAEVDATATLAEARERLRSPGGYDLLVSDINLPDGSGLDLLLDVRAQGLPMAVVVLTSVGDEGIALAAMKAGADDYLPKSDYFADRLPAKAAAALAHSRLDGARRDRRLRVLYVEHSRSDIDLMRRHLQRHAPHLVLEAVETAAEALARLPHGPATPGGIDVLMLDYRLAGESGLELLRELRTVRGLDLPVLMVTGQGGEDVVVQAMQLGATDYLVKHEGYLHVVPQAVENAYHRVAAARETAALQRSEEHLRLVLRGSSDAAWDADVPAARVRLSPRWWQMLGHADAPEALSFEAAFALIPDDRRAAALARFQAVVAGRDEAFEVEIVVRHVDGRAVPLLVRGFVVRDAAGRALRAAGTTTDLTERKRAEAEIQAMNVLLERRVAERTRELELANRELEAFTSSVSHDLRAPLRALQALLTMLQEQESTHLSAEGLRMLRMARDSASRTALLVDDLLRFARHAREAPKRSRVDVEALVRRCLADLQPEIDARRIEVQLGTLPPCDADPNLLQLVWANLLDNAVKYTRQQPQPRIEIDARTEGAHCVYCVRDNGAGFDMAQADRLFGVFQRLHRKEEFDGTGVGLATAARIVERHGGRIWADAAPGRGATFFFHLGDPPLL